MLRRVYLVTAVIVAIECNLGIKYKFKKGARIRTETEPCTFFIHGNEISKPAGLESWMKFADNLNNTFVPLFPLFSLKFQTD